jgi:pyruvate dehydrogenase E2 component (dihydrolipoamide acetyltransferase)
MLETFALRAVAARFLMGGGPMARIPVNMPKLGYDMETGKVAGWLKKVGEKVERGDVLAEIETEKSTVEMESTASGTLVEIVVEAGGELPVGEVIGYLDDGA